MTPNYEELDRLAAGMCDDELSEADLARLAELLDGDAAAQKRYLELVDLHATLALEMECISVTKVGQALAATPASEPEARPMRRRWLVGTLMAASLLLCFWLMTDRRTPEPFDDAFAELTHVEGVEWADAAHPKTIGGRLPAGMLELRAGKAGLLLDNGIELELKSPASIELLDPKTVRLHYGQLNARVPDDGIGFRIATAKADIVDLGTEFGVSVEENGSMEIHVAEGVVVARSTSSSGVVPILRREAGRVEADWPEIIPIPFDPSRFSFIRQGQELVEKLQGLEPIPLDSRMVFLGDETVSRETSLLLMSQAFAELPDKPRLFNAGLAFPLFYEEDDYQHYVARFQPTHVVIVFGPEVAWHDNRHLLRPERFEEAIRRLVSRLEADDIEPILCTGYPLGPQYPDGQIRLNAYNRFLRKLALEGGYRLVDVEAAFRRATNERMTLLVPNGREPTFEGHQVFTTALLRTLGWPQLTVPNTLDLVTLPGILPDWHIRPWPKEEPLESDIVRSFNLDDSWQQVTLPLPIDAFSRRWPNPTHSNICRERLRGFVNSLTRGGRERLVGMSTLTEEAERDAVLNVGGTLIAVWINGEQVFKRNRQHWQGQHAGFDRVPIRLQPGENVIVVDAHVSFFLSITPTHDWPLP